MKNGKRPTRRQLKLLEINGYDPNCYLYVSQKNTPDMNEYTFVHRHTKKIIKIFEAI